MAFLRSCFFVNCDLIWWFWKKKKKGILQYAFVLRYNFLGGRNKRRRKMVQPLKSQLQMGVPPMGMGMSRTHLTWPFTSSFRARYWFDIYIFSFLMVWDFGALQGFFYIYIYIYFDVVLFQGSNSTHSNGVLSNGINERP